MADLKILEMPKYGLSMTEGTVASWLVKPGEAFKKGQAICEIETSKITNEMEAPFAATFYRVIAAVGLELPVGSPIAVVGEANLAAADVEAFVASIAGAKQPEAVAAAPAIAAAPAPAAKAAVPVSAATAPKSAAAVAAMARSIDTPAPGVTSVPTALQGETPPGIEASSRALRLARSLGINLALVKGSGVGGRISVEDIEVAVRGAGGRIAAPASAPVAGQLESRADDSTVPATPVARRLAQKLGINLNDCRATDPRGRVCRDDVLLAAQKFGKLGDEAPAATAAPVLAEGPVVTPLSAMRRVIGQRLVQSKLEAPHFRVTTEIDVERLMALRKEINADIPGVKVSMNDLLVKGVAAALMKVPDVNVCFDADTQSILRYPDADISVAVALDGGLITPIVRAANKKSVTEISAEMKKLVTKAKAGQLQPEEFQGGSFSVSNLGMFGISQFDAIINPPQGAILAAGGTIERVLVKDGKFEARHVLTVSLSCDHRVIDGALGAEFLRELKRLMEAPNLMLV